MTNIYSEHSINATLEKEPNLNFSISPRSNLTCNTSIGRGEKGENGKDGYTPQKYVDYFTEEDIEALELDKRVQEALNFSVEDLLSKLNSEIDNLGLDIKTLKSTDEDIKASLLDILRKMENLVRYSKGEIHKVIIY